MGITLALLCVASAVKIAFSVNDCKKLNKNNNHNQPNRI
jgi:hypothetical protein